MKNNVVGTDCETFLNRVLHEDATEGQRRSMRLAFFAGSKSMMMMMKTLGDEVDEEVSMVVLDMAEREIDDYFKGVKAEAAAERAAAERKPDAGG